MGYWKRTYMYYDSEKAHSVFKSLKRDGVKVKMTSRKLSKWESDKRGSNRVYSIYRWRR